MSARPVMAISLLVGLSWACGTDLRLGDLPRPDLGPNLSDAAVDAGADAGDPDAGRGDADLEDALPPPPPPPPPPVPADGRYLLSFVPGPRVSCQGTLSGSEVFFRDLLPAQVGLQDGEIEVLRSGSVLEVWGDPIMAGYGIARLSLQQTETEGVFLGWQPRMGLGPADTQEDLIRLSMDVEVPAPLAPETHAELRYVDMAREGECLASFTGLLSRL